MPFFKTAPALPDGERARIEFHMQRIAECVGFDRFQLPVLTDEQILSDLHAELTEKQRVELLKIRIADHLRHDVNELKIQTFPMPLEKVGGGG